MIKRRQNAVRSASRAAHCDQNKLRSAWFDGLSVGGTIDGQSGDHILIAPPFYHHPAQLDFVVDTLNCVIREETGNYEQSFTASGGTGIGRSAASVSGRDYQRTRAAPCCCLPLNPLCQEPELMAHAQRMGVLCAITQRAGPASFLNWRFADRAALVAAG